MDTVYGTADTLVWRTLKRKDGTFSRSDVTWDDENDRSICPLGKQMRHTWRSYSDSKRNAPVWKAGNDRALKWDYSACAFKTKYSPKADTRPVHSEKYEAVRDFARTCTASAFNPKAQARRKKVGGLLAHLKRILGARRLG